MNRMKRLVSVILAAALTVSLFIAAPAGAGATAYTDDAEIAFPGAVDVVSALGLMSGYPDGQFGPKRTLTRGAAAKILCTMLLGPDAANALPKTESGFHDVPDGHEFAGYIAYCREHGVIQGYSNGYFEPLASLSGTAFLKMLLGALGYRHFEGFSDDYFVYVVNSASRERGLLENVSAEVNGSPVTREVVATLIVNTLQADMVASNNWTTGRVYFMTWGSEKINPTESNINSRRDSSRRNENVVQFAERYFPGLVRSFNDNIVTWTLYGVQIAQYVAGTWTMDPSTVAQPTITLTPTPTTAPMPVLGPDDALNPTATPTPTAVPIPTSTPIPTPTTVPSNAAEIPAPTLPAA